MQMSYLWTCVLILALSLGPSRSAGLKTRQTGKVIVLDDDNFDNFTATGKWMINLYLPSCPHCRTLEPIWELFARESAEEGLDINVAKADMKTAWILRQRFLVTGVPMVYLLEDGQAWQYKGVRSVPDFKEFATQRYKTTPPLSYFKAPNSPFGRGYGAALYFYNRIPVVLHRTYIHLREEHKLPDLAIFAGLLSIPVMCGLAIICALDAYYTRRSLAHPHAD